MPNKGELVSELLSVKEMAALLKVTPGCVRGWVRQGKFPPAIKLSSGVVRWKRSTVEQWLNSRELQLRTQELR